MTIEQLRTQLAGFESRQADLTSQRAAAEEARKSHVLAAAGGDAKAKKATDEARAQVERVDAELADLAEAIDLAREALEAAEAEADRQAIEAEHVEKLASWRKALAERARAIEHAEKAMGELRAAFAAVDEVSKILVPLHRDIRVHHGRGFEPLEQPYGLHATVERWTSCANGLGLSRFLRRLDMNAPNPPTDFAAEDAKAIAKLEIADTPAESSWAAVPVGVPNRGDGFGNAA